MYTCEGKKDARARTPSREGHSFHVSQTRKSVICSRPRVPDPAKRRMNPARVNDRGRRTHQQAADPGSQPTPLCAHHWLVRLARAWSLLSRAPAEGRQDAHWENWYVRLHEHGGPQDIDSMSTHRPTQRAQPFRWITENDALIGWLGVLQGRRTAVRDVEGNSALKESYDQKRRATQGLLVLGTRLRKGGGSVTP